MTNSFLWTLVQVAPLASSTSALICSVGQQFTHVSLIDPAVPAQARREVWYPFFKSYRNIVFLSAPSHLTTITTCLINYFCGGPQASLWWLLGVAFVVGHAYPLSSGMKMMSLTAEIWNKKTLPETRGWLQDFVDINGTRLKFVDIPGWLCVVVAVVMGLRAEY
ncbi:hypothetical protein QBC44DRAFT_318443 [Cladorrhinum sp. PSN332]|nr:hypothetical protein QBC44DRAFT_318443 [Cladorrhinum sp. PSN332]